MENKEKSLRYIGDKPQFHQLHFKSLIPMIRVLEYGEHKHTLYLDENDNVIPGKDISYLEKDKFKVYKSGEKNWQKGLNSTEILDSAQRHLGATLDGELIDDESKLLHIAHCMTNCLFWIYHYEKSLKT